MLPIKFEGYSLTENTLGARGFSYAVSGFGYFRFRLSLCLSLYSLVTLSPGRHLRSYAQVLIGVINTFLKHGKLTLAGIR